MRDSYTIATETDEVVTLLFGTANGRTQLLYVAWSITKQGLEFAMIASPFARLGQLEIDAALDALSHYVLGGMVIYAETYNVRHAVPLATLDTNEFDGPLRMVLGVADELERQFVGPDVF